MLVYWNGFLKLTTPVKHIQFYITTREQNEQTLQPHHLTARKQCAVTSPVSPPNVFAFGMREHDTPLIAARHGCAVDVVALLDGGADVEEPKTDGSGATPLLITCQEDHHTEVATVLLGAGAAVDKAEKDGYTSLLVACYIAIRASLE